MKSAGSGPIRRVPAPWEDEHGTGAGQRRAAQRQVEYRRDHVHTAMAIMRAGGQDTRWSWTGYLDIVAEEKDSNTIPPAKYLYP